MTKIETGSRLLGVSLKPHQHELGELLDAGEETNAVLWPRRMGKTTAVWCWTLGVALEEDDSEILTTAQSGVKARDRFMKMARVLDRRKPENGPRIYRGAGHEAFEFDNGSRLWVCAPKPESVRGDGVRVALVDEPQELDAEESLDLQQALMPLFDTIDGGQLVLLGTPGASRAGWFWNELEAGAAGNTGIVHGRFAPGRAVSIYAAEDGDDWEDEAVWLRVHLGISSGMTSIEKMRARRAGFKTAQQWAMEYLGVWPGSSDKRAISDELWEAGRLEKWPEKPARFGLAFDVAWDSRSAALVAAWRDAEDRAYVELLKWGTPREVGQEALRVAIKYRLAVAYDAIGANLQVAEGLHRAKPAAKTTPLTMKDMVTGASGLMSELREGNLFHSDQPPMDEAVEAAAWRSIGDSGQLFGRRASAGEVSAVVAGSAALLAFDRLPVAAPIQIRTRRSA
jgi:phage terminase large subunit-like protein